MHKNIRIRLFKSLALFALLTVFIANSAFADPKIYWADKTYAKIYRARIADKIAQELPLGLSTNAQPESLAIDEKNAKLYWSERGTNSIRRSNLDGSAVEDVLTGLTSPGDITFDPFAEKIYWISNNNSILRASTTGDPAANATTIQQVKSIFTGISYAGIAFDSGSTKLYWTTVLQSGMKFISSAPVSPTLPLTPVINLSVANDPTSISTDSLKVFWSTPSNLSIDSAATDLTTSQTFLSVPSSAYRLANSLIYSRIFWSDPATNAIYFSNSASAYTQPFASVSGTPSGVAADCQAYFPSSLNKSYSDDCADFCPSDPDKTSPGYCGCGAIEDLKDSDNDGIPDCVDGCPFDSTNFAPPLACQSCYINLDPNNVDFETFFSCIRSCRDTLAGTPGYDCGCGNSAVDDDGDGAINCQDECPNDARKILRGNCDCGLVDNYDANGKAVCEATRKIAPGTIIETPPVVVVTKKTIKIILEKFKGASLVKIKKKGASIAYVFEVSSAKKPKVTFQYEVTVKKKGGKKADVLNLISKRNELTVKNLKAGDYSSSYRVNIFKDGKAAGKSSTSPAAIFKIS